MHILIAEDEERIARFVRKGLISHGYAATVVSDGIAALDLASTGDVDLVILDVGLPRMDGFTVLKNLRQLGSDVPVIMVTARTAVEDTVQGLEGGANDYIGKPFRFEELLARVRLRLKDATVRSEGASADVLSHGDLRLDVRTRTATWTKDGADVEVELSPREFSLTQVFLTNPNQVLSREQLLSRVWGIDFEGASNVVDVYLRALRGKLGAKRFVTVRGAGYRLIDPS